jgi:hypothetical protein
LRRDRTSAGRRLALAICAALSLATSRADAHGPPAAVTGIAAKDDAGVSVLAFTEGFGIRLPSGWRWICPERFGDELSPPAASADGHTTFVVGQNDLFVLDPDGGIAPQGRPDLSRQTVLSAAALGPRVFALRLLDGGTSDVVALDDAKAIWRADVPYASMTVDDGSLWVARVDGDAGYATRLATDGSVLETLTFSVDPGDAIVQVRRAAGLLYATVVTINAGGKVLLLADGEGGAQQVALASETAVQGPVAAGDAGAWATTAGTLEAVAGAQATPLATDAAASCVGTFEGAPFVCEQTHLLSLGAAGPGEEMFDLSSLQGPAPDNEPPYDEQNCIFQWDVFRYDLSRAGITVTSDAGADASTGGDGSSGCSVARAPGHAPIWRALPLVGLLLFAARAARARRDRR